MDRIAWIKERCKVNDNGCWIWQRGFNTRGYAHHIVVSDGRRINKRIHRWMWELHNGPIPSGAFICHHCDTPACVRIEHLYLGNAKTNRQDCVARGRMNLQCGEGHWIHRTPERVPKGSNRGQAKLNEEAIREIRHLQRADGRLPRGCGIMLAEKYGVTKQTISRVVVGKNWKHVT